VRDSRPNLSGTGMQQTIKQYVVDDFAFLVERDWCADPLTGVAIWVWFRDEPCCDDNGHQYRLYLPLGISNASILDTCSAFVKAVHCSTFADVV